MTFLRWLAEIVSGSVALVRPMCCTRCPVIRRSLTRVEAARLINHLPISCRCGGQLIIGGTRER